jgi:hypothetical protein
MARIIRSRRFEPVALLLICVGIFFAFFADLRTHYAWLLAPTLVLGFHMALARIDQESGTQGFLKVAGISAVLFAGFYDLFDLLIGPDRPLWVITPVAVVAAWAGMLALASSVDDEDDD